MVRRPRRRDDDDRHGGILSGALGPDHRALTTGPGETFAEIRAVRCPPDFRDVRQDWRTMLDEYRTILSQPETQMQWLLNEIELLRKSLANRDRAD